MLQMESHVAVTSEQDSPNPIADWTSGRRSLREEMSRICTARLPVGTRDGIHLVRLRLCETEGAMGN